MIAIVVYAAFFLGAIPFGVIIAKRKGVDIKAKGSGNIGATNVARVIGIGPGLLVLVLDALKGVVSVWLAQWLVGFDFALALAGLMAILGHCFSPFLGGKGGKGVATALGVFVMLAPPLALVGVAVFAVVAGRTRVPALGSLSGIGAATIYAFATGMDGYVSLTALLTTLLLVYTHRGNLERYLTSR